MALSWLSNGVAHTHKHTHARTRMALGQTFIECKSIRFALGVNHHRCASSLATPSRAERNKKQVLSCCNLLLNATEWVDETEHEGTCQRYQG